MATLSSVRTFLPVAGDPVELEAVFSADPGRWLPDARHAGEDIWMIRTRGAQFTRTVRARVGPAWRGGSTLWRGGAVAHVGEFLTVGDGELPVLPVQQPRIPIVEGFGVNWLFPSRFERPEDLLAGPPT